VGNKKIFRYFVSSLSGILFLLFYARSTSPLFPYFHGYDSAFFITMGRALLAGKKMYIDYFDIKGPVFFLWESFGQLIVSGRWGAFILEIICIITSLIILDQIACCFDLTKNKRILGYVLFFCIYAGCLWGGNTVEEFCLPLSLGCLLFCIRYIKGKNLKQTCFVYYGIVAAIFLFSKATVAGTLLSCACMITIVLLKNDPAKLKKGILIFVATFGVIVLTFLIYYKYLGALDDFLKWNFKLAFIRGSDGSYERIYGVQRRINWEISLIPCYAGMMYGFRTIKRKDYTGILLFMINSLAIIVTHVGSAYEYYLISAIPAIMYTFFVLYERFNYKRIIPILLFILFLGGFLRSTVTEVKTLRAKSGIEMHSKYQEFLEGIPEEERDEICCVNPGIRFFADGGILPANRYPINESYFCVLEQSVKAEIIDDCIQKKYTWLFMELDGMAIDEDYEQAIKDNYQSVGYTDDMILWHRK